MVKEKMERGVLYGALVLKVVCIITSWSEIELA